MPAPLPPPGWYADPADPRGWRWWNGWTWTPYAAPAAPAGPGGSGPPPAGGAWAGAAYKGESTMEPWARAATVVYPALAAVAGFVNLATASAWRAYFHDLRVVFEFDTGTTVARLHVATPSPWNDLAAPFILTAEVLFLTWQHRAATTARRLGYPAVRSPGLGVGSYFIPVVNLWFPYQALRDCLPPDSEHRRLVLAVWLLLILTGVINAVLVFLLAELPALGDVFLGVLVILETMLAFGGYRMVQAISAAHRRALGSG